MIVAGLVALPFGGQPHEVHSLRSLAEAGMVGMALAVKAMEELQRVLDGAHLAGEGGRPGCRLPAAAVDAPQLPSAPFTQLVQQLQACADWCEGFAVDEGEDVHPLSGLMHAAIDQHYPEVLQLLLRVDPSAACCEWPSEGQGTAVHSAVKYGHPDALPALMAAAPEAATTVSQGYTDKGGAQFD
ncbi:hypothetical protein ABPG75_012920 [Micractinium tetrahymenae]